MIRMVTVLENPLVYKAKLFATQAHNGQVRRYTGEPYVTHPVAVSEILAHCFEEPEVLAAGLLHDVIEDTDFSKRDIEIRFGSKVSELVDEVTKITTRATGNRELRVKLECEHLAGISFHGKSIKLADIIQNLTGLAELDPKFALQYTKEKQLALKSLKGGHPLLWSKAAILVDEIIDKLNS